MDRTTHMFWGKIAQDYSGRVLIWGISDREKRRGKPVRTGQPYPRVNRHHETKREIELS
jgi:hypothetical protein